MTARPPSRRVLVALTVLAAVGLVVAACSSSGGSGTSSTTDTTGGGSLQIPLVYTDPAKPVVVPVGRRFAIMLPADPAHGWSWVVDPVDTRYLAPLGSEFRDEPALLERATTTTTTAPPPAPETTPVLPGQTTTTTLPPDTTEAPSTTTTAPGPLVQIISFAGRSAGAPTVTLHYERIGTGEDAPEAAETLVFHVLVGTPPPVPVSEPPPS
jgi:hypothetical protein